MHLGKILQKKNWQRAEPRVSRCVASPRKKKVGIRPSESLVVSFVIPMRTSLQKFFNYCPVTTVPIQDFDCLGQADSVLLLQLLDGILPGLVLSHREPPYDPKMRLP